MRIEIFVVKTELTLKLDRNTELARLNVIKSEITHEFGGMTVIPNCIGYWEQNNHVCLDDVDLWLIYTASKDSLAITEAYAKRIKKLTYQKEQAFTIDGKLYLV